MNRAVIVVPVRLAFGTRALQSTSRALDEDGLFVRCVAPPPLGSAVSVRLYLPDGPPEDIQCVIVPEHELREVGCRVRFTGLTQQQRARILRLIAPPMLRPMRAATFAPPPASPLPPSTLPTAAARPPRPVSSPPASASPSAPPAAPSAQAPSSGAAPAPLVRPSSAPPPVNPSRPAPPASHSAPDAPGAPLRSPLARIELRALSRVPVQLKVRFESIDALAERLALDISAGGMFVRAEHPPLVGEEVQLLFALPGDELPPLTCRALVVRRIAEEEGRLTGRSPGCGVQFIDASDSFRARLDAWLLQAQGLTEL